MSFAPLNNVLPSYEAVMLRVDSLSSGRLKKDPFYRYHSRASWQPRDRDRLVSTVDEMARLAILKAEEAAEERRKRKTAHSTGRPYVLPGAKYVVNDGVSVLNDEKEIQTKIGASCGSVEL